MHCFLHCWYEITSKWYKLRPPRESPRSALATSSWVKPSTIEMKISAIGIKSSAMKLRLLALGDKITTKWYKQ